MSYESDLGAIRRTTTAIKMPGAAMAPKPPVNKIRVPLDKASSTITLAARRFRTAPPNRMTVGKNGRFLRAPRVRADVGVLAPAALPGAGSVRPTFDVSAGGTLALTAHPGAGARDAGVLPGEPPAASVPFALPTGILDAASSTRSRVAPTTMTAGRVSSGPTVVMRPGGRVDPGSEVDAAEAAVSEDGKIYGVDKKTLLIGGAAVVGALLLWRRLG